MNTFFGIIIGLVILMLLVIAHEFGHFIMARKNGVKVNEFGIGFPPRAIAWVRNPKWKKDVKTKQKPFRVKSARVVSVGTDDSTAASHDSVEKKWIRIPKSEWEKPQENLILSLNWLPIGGFCAMDGESAADRRKGTFGAASFWAKTKILFAGVMMNWLVAFVVLTVLAVTGMPQFIEHQFYLGQDAKQYTLASPVVVAEVLADSPAAVAGFQPNDQIVAIDTVSVAQPSDVTAYGLAHPGEKVTYHIIRGQEEQTLTATLNPADAEYSLGIKMSGGYGQTLIRSTWSAPIVGAGLTLQLTGETFRGLGEMVWNLCSGLVRQLSPNSSDREAGRTDIGAAGDAVSGPVGILGVIFPMFASTGITNLAFLTALISVSLACMNVLPVPALDGGRWLLIAIYKLRHKELTKETEEKIVSRAFMVLFGLIILITLLDIIKISHL